MLTAMFIIDGLIVAFIAVKLVKLLRRKRPEEEQRAPIELSMPEEKRMDEENAPE